MPVIGNKTNILGSSNPGKVKVKTTTTVVIAENEARQGLEIVNGSGNTVYLYPGKAAAAEEGITLLPGGSWNGEISGKLWYGAVNGICPAAESTIQVIEV